MGIKLKVGSASPGTLGGVSSGGGGSISVAGQDDDWRKKLQERMALARQQGWSEEEVQSSALKEVALRERQKAQDTQDRVQALSKKTEKKPEKNKNFWRDTVAPIAAGTVGGIGGFAVGGPAGAIAGGAAASAGYEALRRKLAGEYTDGFHADDAAAIGLEGILGGLPGGAGKVAKTARAGKTAIAGSRLMSSAARQGTEQVIEQSPRNLLERGASKVGNYVDKKGVESVLQASPSAYTNAAKHGVDLGDTLVRLQSKFGILDDGIRGATGGAESKLKGGLLKDAENQAESQIQLAVQAGKGTPIDGSDIIKQLRQARQKIGSRVGADADSERKALDELITGYSKKYSRPRTPKQALTDLRAANEEFGRSIIDPNISNSMSTYARKMEANMLRAKLKDSFPMIREALDDQHDILTTREVLQTAFGKGRRGYQTGGSILGTVGKVANSEAVSGRVVRRAAARNGEVPVKKVGMYKMAKNGDQVPMELDPKRVAFGQAAPRAIMGFPAQEQMTNTYDQYNKDMGDLNAANDQLAGIEAGSADAAQPLIDAGIISEDVIKKASDMGYDLSEFVDNGQPIPDGMTPDQMNMGGLSMSPDELFKQAYAELMAGNAKGASALMSMAEFSQKVADSQAKQAQLTGKDKNGKKLTAAQQKTLMGVNTADSLVNDIESKLGTLEKEGSVGRIGGNVSKLKGFVGLNDNASAYEANRPALALMLIKAVQGSAGQISDADRDAINHSIPSVSDTPGERKNKVKTLRTIIESYKSGATSVPSGGQSFDLGSLSGLNPDDINFGF